MMWEIAKLGDISRNIQTGPFGSQLHQSDYSESGIPVVMPKDLVGGKISEESIARVDKTHVERLCRHKIETGDILYSRRGDVGRCAYVTEKEVGWLCGTGCLRVTIDSEKADSRFVFFQLQHPDTVGWVEKHAVGATMLNLNTTILSSVPIRLPALESQKRIANVLSAYDDLIENNQKQIKLLEEAAQRLYKEWFVDLRFPGHENTKIVDGVPEGWNECTVESFGTVITGKTPSTSNKEYYTNGKVPFVTIPDMHNVVYPLKTEKRLTIEGAQTQKNKYIPPNSVMISCIGTVGLVSIATEVCQTNQQINSIILYNEDDLYFFYESMLRMKDLLDGLGSNGATMTNVNKSKLEKLIIISPSKDIVKQYNDVCKPLFESALNLSRKNVYLQNMREALLPKLMSGEMEI